ncbi:MAG: hypothetical protein ABR590_08055 [Spirochaetia bacterium]
MVVKKIELRIDWVQLIQIQSENIERGFNQMRLPDRSMVGSHEF